MSNIPQVQLPKSDNLNKNKFSSINNNSMYNNTNIVDIDIEKYNSIEKEREKIQMDEQFQQWCKDMKIGSRVEVKDYHSTELMNQYTNYPKWVARLY